MGALHIHSLLLVPVVYIRRSLVPGSSLLLCRANDVYRSYDAGLSIRVELLTLISRLLSIR